MLLSKYLDTKYLYKAGVNYTLNSRNINRYYSKTILFHKTSLNNASAPVIYLQKRKISNETHILKEAYKTKSSNLDSSAAEDSAKILSSQIPDYVKEISEWKFVEIAQNTLLKVHELSGLPWWASIALTALAARATITLPFSIIMMHNTAKIQMIQIEMNNIVEKLKKEANYACTHHGWTENLARQHYNKAVRREYKNLIIRDNCHPAKSYIYLLIQLPLWLSFSLATRNLTFMLPHPDINAQITYMELMVGGFGWIKNLTDVDHYFILPISIALMNLIIMEVHEIFRSTPVTKFDKLRKYIFRGISLVMIPIASSVPVALNIYWLSSSSFGLIQAFLMNSPRFRRFFNVPRIKNELDKPYRHFYTQLKSKFVDKKLNTR